MSNQPDPETKDPCRLYLITPPVLEPESFAEILDKTLKAGDVAAVQLRLKDGEQTANADIIRRAADHLMPVAHKHKVAFLINDRPDIAAEIGADGAHIGQQDMAYAQARELLGKDRIIGVSCHDSKDFAMIAAAAGADYIAFGAFFPTQTKAITAHPKPELISWWTEMFETPCVAIGGIKTGNAHILVDAGADFIAICTGIWDEPQGPDQAVRDFTKITAR